MLCRRDHRNLIEAILDPDSIAYTIMRVVQVQIPNGTREAVLAVLDDEDIDDTAWEATGHGDFEALGSVPILESGVEAIFENLEELVSGEHLHQRGGDRACHRPVPDEI